MIYSNFYSVLYKQLKGIPGGTKLNLHLSILWIAGVSQEVSWEETGSPFVCITVTEY